MHIKKMKMKQVGLLFLFVIIAVGSLAQLIAFPGAEGFGKYTTGGRGTTSVAPKIFEVTKLDDDGTAGTLRYACTNNSPSAPNRIIVFRVAGTIHLNSVLSLIRANTTIAGQTAPGGGICVADYPVTIGANNMIIRYIRFRLGDKNQAPTLGMDDAFGDNGGGRQKVIIDHCTMSWSTDEGLTMYKGDSVTLQWNMISEPLDYSYHTESGVVQQHAYGGIESGKHISIHHNLYAHIRGRMPRFDGIRNAAVDTADYRNNVLYNWADYTVNGGEGGAYNVVGNYYKYGLNSPTGSTSGVIKKAMVVNPYKTTTIPYGKWYVTGNYVDGYPTVTDRNWLGAAMNGGTYADTTTAKSDDPINTGVPINTNTALQAYDLVLANAGATLPARDTLDQRIVNNVINRTGTLINTQGGYPGYPTYTPYATTQSAWPALAAGTPQTDADHDGMPDAWELQRGLNPNSNADLNGYISNTGYSNIENYLNGDTIAAPGVLNTCIAAKQITAAGNGGWLFARDTTYSDPNSSVYLSAADSNNVAAAILDNGAFGAFDISYYTTGTLRTDPVTGKPYLNRNVTITPANPALITAPVTVRIYISRKEFDDLKAADPTIASVADLNILKLSGANCTGNLTAGYTTIAPTSAGSFGSYNNGYFVEFQTSSFSTFYIGSKTNFVLPLRLVSFDARLQDKKVFTTWQSDNEINLALFRVEKSRDAIQFNEAGRVQPHNVSGSFNYNFIDNAPYSGISFYRLKIFDADGKFYLSDVKKIINDGRGSLIVVPNPAKQFITVTHAPADKSSFLKIISSTGSIVLQKVATAGSLNSVIDINMLPAGTYTLVFENGNILTSEKIVIIH
jgi:hypothetical protein